MFTGVELAWALSHQYLACTSDLRFGTKGPKICFMPRNQDEPGLKGLMAQHSETGSKLSIDLKDLNLIALVPDLRSLRQRYFGRRYSADYACVVD